MPVKDRDLGLKSRSGSQVITRVTSLVMSRTWWMMSKPVITDCVISALDWVWELNQMWNGKRRSHCWGHLTVNDKTVGGLRRRQTDMMCAPRIKQWSGIVLTPGNSQQRPRPDRELVDLRNTACCHHPSATVHHRDRKPDRYTVTSCRVTGAVVNS